MTGESTSLQSSQHQKSPRHTLRKTEPTTGRVTPPYAVSWICVGETLLMFISPVAFLYVFSRTTLHCAPVSTCHGSECSFLTPSEVSQTVSC